MARVTILNALKTSAVVEVHGEGCGDITRKVRARSHEVSYTFEFETTREVWLDYNLDFLEESGPTAAWEMKFLPCCGLKVDNDRSFESEV
jgi:hypothetical protein